MWQSPSFEDCHPVSLFSSEWLAAYGTEWVVLLIFIKLVIGLSNGIQAFLAEIPLWQVDFAKYFLSVEVFAAIGVVAQVWTICGYYAELLDNLGLDRAGVENYQVTLGGDGTEDAAIGEKTGPGFSADDIVPAIERLVMGYLDLRETPEETFLETYRRLGMEPFKAVLYPAEEKADAA